MQQGNLKEKSFMHSGNYGANFLEGKNKEKVNKMHSLKERF